jgi:hypothetical protein
LRILRAGIETVLHVSHVGQGAGIISHRGYVHYPGDVNSTMADKNADPRRLPSYVDLCY